MEEATCSLKMLSASVHTAPEGFPLVLCYLPSDSLSFISGSQVHTVSTDGRSKGWTRKIGMGSLVKIRQARGMGSLGRDGQDLLMQKEVC